MDIEQLQYPIGRFQPPTLITIEDRAGYIKEITTFPEELKEAVSGLSDEQLNTPYRPGGWTIRQVVHHLPDSHGSSYIRFKWALTENKPLIKVYNQQDWSNLIDARLAPIDISLNMLSGIHGRWVWLMTNMTEDDWHRAFIHPETNGVVPLDRNLALYAWHGKHHLGHITSLKKREGW